MSNAYLNNVSMFNSLYRLNKFVMSEDISEGNNIIYFKEMFDKIPITKYHKFIEEYEESLADVGFSRHLEIMKSLYNLLLGIDYILNEQCQDTEKYELIQRWSNVASNRLTESKPYFGE